MFLEDFNSYTPSGTDINGGSGGSGFSGNWSGSGGILSDSSVVYGGAFSAKATSAGLGGNSYERPLTTALSGSGILVYGALRRDSSSSGELRVNLRTASGDNDAVTIKMNASGQIVIGSSSPVVVGTYAINSWYAFRLTIDTGGSGSYTAAISADPFGTSGTWGTESASKAFQNAGSLGFLLLDFGSSAGTGVTNYWDEIGTTSPFTSAPVFTPRRALMGVGL
ncbi:hypothetical protein [Bradyrhizobium sp. UNPF46]|uniref:hypothetical protein n=1 Tax=Bradyrhizobium sp. UNPF46 TaxID=1141168 RepID=UPI0011503F7A|nr:hypothetical protein [Bradyrhizobium sp. UNPF46]